MTIAENMHISSHPAISFLKDYFDVVALKKAINPYPATMDQSVYFGLYYNITTGVPYRSKPA